jgi:uncharacterized protein
VKRKDNTFNAFELARDGGVLQGTLDVGALDRLADRVAPEQTDLSWRIAGTADEVGRPALEVSIDGTVMLTCQRCLSDFGLPVAHRALTLLAKGEKEADALDAASAHEVVIADHPLDPAELVEDELLLTLPFAPMHESACAPGGDH